MLVTKTSLSLVHLNMQDTKVSTYELFLGIASNTLACIQEPWIVKRQMKGLLQHLKTLSAASPKAAVVMHKSMIITPLPHLTTLLVATVLLCTAHSTPTLKQIVVVSCYWTQAIPLPPEFEFEAVVDYITTSKKNLSSWETSMPTPSGWDTEIRRAEVNSWRM